jgi:hypothetical protein
MKRAQTFSCKEKCGGILRNTRCRNSALVRVASGEPLCLQEPWQRLTLSKSRYKLFLLPG